MTEFVEVQEGAARLLMPAGARQERGPGTKATASVFYNPAMVLNRDVSSLCVHARARDGWHVLDGLAATGARGVRYALEACHDITVEFNDWNPSAVKLAEENARRNGLEPRVTRRNLAALLHENVWHLVDVDPYGSPVPFLDAAARAVRHGGVLGVTATDTTALAGVYPRTCRRRYHALPLHGELGHEVALRILVAGTVLAGARHDVGYRPLLAHATDHYYRAMFEARKGAKRADDALAHIDHVWLCMTCGARGFGRPVACAECGADKPRIGGPCWTGSLGDADTLAHMAARLDAHALGAPEATRALVTTLRAEAEAPPLFYDLHAAGSRAGTGSPPRAAVVARLEAHGYHTGPVHFLRHGLRTDAPARDVMAAVRESAREADRPT